MYKDRKVLGIITARGGSKGIPRKNIRELCGRPLIAYAIEAANSSKLLTRCIVSTEDAEIADIARRHGGDVPFMRPMEFARDDSTSMEVMQHAIMWFREWRNEEYDYIMNIPPTAPLRNSGDIDACIKIATETNADSVMSMVEVTDFTLKKMKIIKDGVICSYAEDEGKTSSRRQDQLKVYKRNAAIYLTKANFIMAGDLFGRVSRAYIMPEERSVDINVPVDFELAEFWLNRLK